MPSLHAQMVAELIALKQMEKHHSETDLKNRTEELCSHSDFEKFYPEFDIRQMK
jgi:hypothetical protein